jgi:hypothetical protein
MEKTRAQIQALKEELDAWMEKHDLTHDTFWRTPEEEYGEECRNFSFPHYLVLLPGSDLSSVLNSLDHVAFPWKAEMLREFEGIVDRHGCWVIPKDNLTFNIADGREREGAGSYP